ncbi:phage tail fiber domain-containing protein [Klebsiella pneumoniae]|uniref:phage tail fiber domain-containing protein n=1 Tax=Klebsiella pneumoniae TaxID=573 RepID=UPI000DCAE7DC|nr:phage tail fiber protein [Klebsiella pneumoniae]HBT2393907.1 hypothetical protein [Klebsiella pneumoniae subsp. pneumoniae]MBC6355122.1 hypothetical protein [Klebsiella pneumoniae]MBS8152163.1 hypothetical protein [Klebsiella pneumoniae]MBS8195567.1 hypothetical protein [Klebsiella pneumoniae]MBS8206492.1 hypothetical protein [Klebsiella pneumoniae]
MSVPNQTPYNIYTANGLTTVFAYEFYLISASDIQVTINGNEVTSGYTVSGVGNQDGGEVTFQTPPADGALVMLERVVPTYRLTDYQDNGDLLADTVNKDFDRIWMAIQRVFINLGFALTRPFLGGPFNAKGYRIENLADPVNEQDAATKKFVIETGKANLTHTLRFPEKVNQMPGAGIRRHSLQGYNDQGEPVPVFSMTDTADLALKLASDYGQLLIGAPESIDSLRDIYPANYARIETKGAFSAGDGGDGSWVYDHADLSEEVSLYPRLFIAPNVDPSGISGAWRPNIGKKLIKLAAIGFGVLGLNAAAGDTWPQQAAEAAQANKEILEQCALWDGGKREKIIPPAVIYTSSYSFPTVNPNLKASFGTSSSTGPFFLTHEDLSSDPVFDIGSLDGRLSGFNLENITVGSYKFFSVPNYNTFTDARDNRTCFRFQHVGTRVKVSGLYAGGFTRGYYLSEPWDGVQEECRALYCSNPQGTIPAYFIGSQESDNANAMEIRRLHIEFSPYAAEIGFCEHVNLIDSKIEAYRAANATHPLVRIQPQCSKINITGCQFVTNNATSYHAIEDFSQFTNFNQCWFAGADDENYPQAGIHWYKRVNPNNSQTTFTNCHFNRCHVADGSDPNDYPIILGNYAVFDAVCRASSEYKTSSGIVTTINSGFINCGSNCTVKRVHFVVGTATKAYGPAIWFTGTGNLVRRVTNTAGDNIFRLAGGDANNAIDSWGNQYLNTTASLIYTYGKRDVILTAATNVMQLFGFVGDIIRITSNSSGSTITNSANIITSSGANITMAAGVTYTFRMSSGSVARQVTA